MYVCMYVTIYSYIHTYILFIPFTVLVMGLMGQIKKSLIPQRFKVSHKCPITSHKSHDFKGLMGHSFIRRRIGSSPNDGEWRIIASPFVVAFACDSCSYALVSQ